MTLKKSGRKSLDREQVRGLPEILVYDAGYGLVRAVGIIRLDVAALEEAIADDRRLFTFEPSVAPRLSELEEQFEERSNPWPVDANALVRQIEQLLVREAWDPVWRELSDERFLEELEREEGDVILYTRAFRDRLLHWVSERETAKLDGLRTVLRHRARIRKGPKPRTVPQHALIEAGKFLRLAHAEFRETDRLFRGDHEHRRRVEDTALKLLGLRSPKREMRPVLDAIWALRGAAARARYLTRRKFRLTARAVERLYHEFPRNS